MLPVKGSPTTRNDTGPVLTNDRGRGNEPTGFDGVRGTLDCTGALGALDGVVHGGNLGGGDRNAQ